MILTPQKKGEERKCNSGDWTTLKPKHSLSPHINIKKKKGKTEISKKTGTNGNTLKKKNKKKQKQRPTREFMHTQGQNYGWNIFTLYQVLFC